MDWRSRGYLPHISVSEAPQSVTFHLYDSYPTAQLVKWEEELRFLPKDEAERERHKHIEAYLDFGHGDAWLRYPLVAEMVQNALFFFDETRYFLHAWVIMPNHVHALFTPIHPFDLDTILHSWKSYTSSQANKLLHRKGPFWFREYFDRFIRNEEHYANAIGYIENNPLKANLCTSPEDWLWSSARYC